MSQLPHPEFDDAYFARMNDAGQHWWVSGMHRIGRQLLPKNMRGWRVLDAGCGAGASLPWLNNVVGRSGAVVGCDFALAGLAAAHDHAIGTALVAASVVDLPFAASCFDLVVSTDVLQHLSSDDARRALGEAHRVLRPGGRLLARTNCAHLRKHVRIRDDWRLYAPAMLRRELEAAGFAVKRLSPVNCAPALASLLVRPDKADGAEHGQVAALGIPKRSDGIRDTIGRAALGAERHALRLPLMRLPFGHSLIAVGQRS